MAELKTGDLALGVVRPFPGQEENYCGVAACTAFKDMLLNALTPIRYSKVAFGAQATAGTGITFSADTLVAFAHSVGETAASDTGFSFALTQAETNYQDSENPVPQNGGFLFCMVGLGIVPERPYHYNSGTDAREYPDYLTQTADYSAPIREELLSDVSVQIAYGNNGCRYDIGLAKHYPSPNSPHGADLVAPGVIAGTLMFTPLNSVVCIDSLKNNRRATINLTLSKEFLVKETSNAVATESVIAPLELSMFGFVIQVPSSQDFFTGPSLPSPKAAQGWR